MLIREYTPADLDALRRMHASQGFDYAFPNLDDPIFISKLILEDDSGCPVMAALARLTCEMYLLIDRAADSSCSAGLPRVTSRGILPAVLSPADRRANASDHAGRADNVSFRAKCPAPLPLREAPGHAVDAASNACHSERSPAPFSSRGVSAARDAAEESLLDVSCEETATPREIPRVARNNNSHVGPRAGNARQRWTQLLALHRAGELDLLARGLDDAHAWLPPQVARRFGRRLESLGWLRDNTWTPYCKRLKSSG